MTTAVKGREIKRQRAANRPLKIFIVDDHRVVCDGLQLFIDRQADMKVVGIALNGEDAIPQILRKKPHIVIMDVQLPGMGGILATRKVMSAGSDIRVVALSMWDERGLIIGMFKAGAMGYVLKDSGHKEIVKSIHLVASGEYYLSKQITKVLLSEILNPDNSSPDHAELTKREKDIIGLIAEDKSSYEIACALNVSVKTVEKSRHSIREKRSIIGPAGFVKLAIQEGLTGFQ